MRRVRTVFVTASVLLVGCTDDAPTLAADDVTTEVVAAALTDVCTWDTVTWSSHDDSSSTDITSSPTGTRIDIEAELGASTPSVVRSLMRDGRAYLQAGGGGWVSTEQFEGTGSPRAWALACEGVTLTPEADDVTVDRVAEEGDGFVVELHVLSEPMTAELAADGSLRALTSGDTEVTVSPDVDEDALEPPSDVRAVSQEEFERAVLSRSTEER